MQQNKDYPLEYTLESRKMAFESAPGGIYCFYFVYNCVTNYERIERKIK